VSLFSGYVDVTFRSVYIESMRVTSYCIDDLIMLIFYILHFVLRNILHILDVKTVNNISTNVRHST